MDANNKFITNELACIDGVLYYGNEELGSNAVEVTNILSNRYSVKFEDMARFVNEAKRQ